MLLDISHIGQIGFGVADIDRVEDFYGRTLGLRKLFRFGDLTFFDCGGIRLLLEKRRGAGDPVHGGTIYLRCADLALAVEELRARGVTFSLGPHLIARMDDHDLWMAFFLDPDGNSLALMQEAPKGYSPVADCPRLRHRWRQRRAPSVRFSPLALPTQQSLLFCHDKFNLSEYRPLPFVCDTVRRRPRKAPITRKGGRKWQ